MIAGVVSLSCGSKWHSFTTQTLLEVIVKVRTCSDFCWQTRKFAHARTLAPAPAHAHAHARAHAHAHAQVLSFYLRDRCMSRLENRLVKSFSGTLKVAIALSSSLISKRISLMRFRALTLWFLSNRKVNFQLESRMIEQLKKVGSRSR